MNINKQLSIFVWPFNIKYQFCCSVPMNIILIKFQNVLFKKRIKFSMDSTQQTTNKNAKLKKQKMQ